MVAAARYFDLVREMPNAYNHRLRMRIKEIAAVRVRYGYYRIYILLRREGWTVNHMF